MPVSTVLVGPEAGVVNIPLTGGYTVQVRVPANVGALRQVARTSGGRFYRARAATALKRVYEELATRVGQPTKDREIAEVFAAAGIVLLFAAVGASLYWFRRVL